MPRRSLARPALLATLVLLACGPATPPAPVPVQLPALTGDPWIDATYRPAQARACELGPSDLATEYPEPAYLESLSYDPSKAAHLPAITAYLHPKPEHAALLAKNGFYAIDRPSPSSSFAEAFSELYDEHLPVLITADSMLHVLHQSFDSLLQDFEFEILIPTLHRMLGEMHAQLGKELPDLPAALRPAALDLDAYLTVARSFLTGTRQEPVSDDAAVVEAVAGIMSNAADLQPATITLFGATFDYDYSQLKPRGHYEFHPDLSRYFQAMIWLGRSELRMLTFVQGQPQFNRRGVEAAVLAGQLLRSSGAEHSWARANKIQRLLVGEPDAMSPADLPRFMADAGITTPSSLAAVSDEVLLQTLVRGTYGLQQIASQIMVSSLHGPRQPLPRVFLLLGQRYTIDSHILSQVTFDRVKDLSTDRNTPRMLPSELDVLFALGNDRAALHLAPELAKWGYQGVLHELRFLVDAHPAAHWDSSFYNGWLAALRTLDDNTGRERRPEAMRTAAWADKTLTTQAASWAELRHDTILYTKQSMSGSITCEYPDAYVEPLPHFYARLGQIARLGSTLITELRADLKVDPLGPRPPPAPVERDEFYEPGGEQQENVPSTPLARAEPFFTDLATAAGTLEAIATKELAGTALTLAEKGFLKATIEKEQIGCGEIHYDGWYANLYYDRSKIALFTPTITDIHTAPTDAAGNPTGHVLHAATSRPLMLVLTVPDCTGVRAFVGPTSSYHSLLTTDFARKSDSEWEEMLGSGPQPRPSWTASYVP
jgi:hypothetical protein